MKLTMNDIKRALVYVSRPDLCTVPGLIEWVTAMADDLEQVLDPDTASADAIVTPEGAAPLPGEGSTYLGTFDLRDYAGELDLYRCDVCGVLLSAAGVDRHWGWHRGTGR